MIIAILGILLIYVLLLTLAWVWFFKNEKLLCGKLYAAGLEALNNENYKKAKGFFSRIHFLSPNYKDTKYKLAYIELKLANYEHSEDLLKQVIKLNPKDFNALLNLALVYQYLEKYDKAEEYYQKALEQNNKSPDCHYGLGLITYKRSDYQKALDYFINAENYNSKHPRLEFYINKCKDELCNYEESEEAQSIIESYLKMAGDEDLPLEYNISLATAYAKIGNLEMANEYCQKSLLENTEDIGSYKLLGLIQLAKKDYVATKATLSTALHLDPRNKELHDILSYALCQQMDDCPLQKCREIYNELMYKFLT